MTKPSAAGNVMIKAAREAGRSLARDFGEAQALQVSRKGPADFVTAADLRAEEIIFESLSKSRPGYGFIMEERGVVEGTDKENTFIVDPLDGTLNFMHGQPHYSVSIGLVREGELFCGVVYDVAKNEIFWAETGRGAWLEQTRLNLGRKRKLGDAVIATGTPWRGKDEAVHQTFLAELGALMPRCAGIRRYGSAALDLAYVAAGRFDAFWERGLKPWDVAAGIVLVREAGGKVEAPGGGDPLRSGDVLAAHLDLHDEIKPILNGAARSVRAH